MQDKSMESLEKNMSDFFDYQKKMLNSFEVLLNVGEVEVGITPKTLFFEEDKMKVYHYESLSKKKSIVPTLIVYALVNREYLVDMEPEKSFVRNLLENGQDLYIVDWGYPTAQDKYVTLDDYIDVYINDVVDAIREETGREKINILGICEGGLFSTIYSALYPQKVKNLVTMIAPIDFEAGAASGKGFLFNWSKYMNVDNLVDTVGIIPGEMLNLSFDMLKPFHLMVNKYIAMPDNFMTVEGAQSFMRMEKWILDSPDQAGEAFRKLIKELYQENRLVKGTFYVGKRRVDLKNITMPVLTIYGDKDHIVPPEATKPLNELVGSKDKEIAAFPVGHAGIYVSSKSQSMIAPKVIEWLNAREK